MNGVPLTDAQASALRGAVAHWLSELAEDDYRRDLGPIADLYRARLSEIQLLMSSENEKDLTREELLAVIAGLPLEQREALLQDVKLFEAAFALAALPKAKPSPSIEELLGELRAVEGRMDELEQRLEQLENPEPPHAEGCKCGDPCM